MVIISGGKHFGGFPIEIRNLGNNRGQTFWQDSNRNTKFGKQQGVNILAGFQLAGTQHWRKTIICTEQSKIIIHKIKIRT